MSGSEKYKKLELWFENKGKVAIAFSGGVDSTFVLAVANKVLGKQVIAFTIKTPYIPDRELEEAIAWCSANGIRHKVLHIAILPEIMNNPENRCYLCKHHVFSMLKKEALAEGFNYLLDGTNADDSGVHRPGLKALEELDIKSPLLENGITKKDVREFSGEMGLPTAEKPSNACLLTRLPYNYKIDITELQRIEKAELFLASIGFGASRVRNHGNIARIEIEKGRLSEFVNSYADATTTRLHELGYTYVTIDLDGYRTGSFDIKNKK